jgi:sigma-B regulation protein RsbU (phosphoserine phosphatase)
MVNRCLIYLEKDNEMQLALGKGFIVSDDEQAIRDNDVLAHFRLLTEPYETNADSDNRFSKQLQAVGISVLIPMRIQNETKGVIALGDKITKADFLPGELAFLSTLGNLSMISIENARLFEETLEKQRLERELLIAREIQERLLPEQCPEIENFDVAALNLSSLQVGGDYYDVVQLTDHRYAFCIADVSGKGAPAALLMSNLQASFHALLTVEPELPEIARKINNLIYRNTSFDKYITCFFGILDTNNLQFTSVNAGHNPPYLFHADKSFELLSEGGLILGMMPDIEYQQEIKTLRPGDLILMYTDGVNEAMNLENEEFGEERIEQCVVSSYTLSAGKIIHELTSELKAFSEDTPQSDDITMVTLKFHSGKLEKTGSA